jgi:hypothetical protein
VLLSEEEARQRWCPHARAMGYARDAGNITKLVAGYNRDHPDGNIPACIASHCMAWRWSEPKTLKDIDLVTSDVVASPPRLGFCGLSGIPQYGD